MFAPILIHLFTCVKPALPIFKRSGMKCFTITMLRQCRLPVLLLTSLLFSIIATAQCGYSVSATPTHVNCFNGTTGTITVNITGGTGPFSYQLAEAGAGAWQSGNVFTALTANTYPVSVRDGSGCITTIYITINQPEVLTTAYTAIQSTCFNANNGSITTTTVGGTAPYSYSWDRNGSPYASTPAIQNLSPGNYFLTITDANGCSTSPIIESAMLPVALTGFTVDVIANGTGSASSSTTGGLDNSPAQALYSSDYNNGSSTGAGGLPVSGVFSSVQDNGREYRLASYTANNSLILRSASNPDLSTGSTTGVLTFASQNKSLYSTLYVVGTTGNGTGVVNYTVRFTDGGATHTGSLNFPDWHLAPGTSSTARALGNLDRVSLSESTFTGSENFNLFEAPITIPVPSQGREIDRVDFEWGGSDNARINLFAITGYTSTAYGIRINDGPASDVSPSVYLTHDAPGNQFCTGQLVTFTANPINAGSSPTYQWFINNNLVTGASSPIFSSAALATNDVVSVTITAGGAGISCLTTNTGNAAVTLHVADRTAAVSIATAAETVCSSSTVSFTATATNGGASPSYQWQVNGSNAGVPTSSATYISNTLNSADAVRVIMTSSIACADNNPATSNTVTMTVLPTGTPQVAITAVPAVDFSSTASFGGSAPLYQWYRNGVAIAGAESSSYSTTTAQTGELYSLKMTSDYLCRTAPAAMSNYIQITPMTLPVLLQSFTVKQEGSKVKLSWETTYESNSRHFLVQRSIGTTMDFRTIANVAATNLPGGDRYSFEDIPGFGGLMQYRLVMEDMDGKQEFSAIRSVRMNQESVQAADAGHAWRVQSNQPLQYILTDKNGRVLRNGSSPTSFLLDKPLARGIYFLRIYAQGQVYFFKVSHL